MKQLLKVILSVVMISIAACKKDPAPAVEPEVPQQTGDIVVPAGFNWETSRNVTLTVNITNAQYEGFIHVVTIYDGDPVLGKLLSKGSANTFLPFTSKFTLPKTTTSVYVVSTAPDNSSVTRKAELGTSETASITIAN